jgi:hypothetical protein
MIPLLAEKRTINKRKNEDLVLSEFVLFLLKKGMERYII